MYGSLSNFNQTVHSLRWRPHWRIFVFGQFMTLPCRRPLRDKWSCNDRKLGRGRVDNSNRIILLKNGSVCFTKDKVYITVYGKYYTSIPLCMGLYHCVWSILCILLNVLPSCHCLYFTVVRSFFCIVSAALFCMLCLFRFLSSWSQYIAY